MICKDCGSIMIIINQENYICTNCGLQVAVDEKVYAPKVKNLHIKNSYKTWSAAAMETIIWQEWYNRTYNGDPAFCGSPSMWLNRSMRSMYIEWWLHNIGYYLTLPFCEYDFIRRLNLRFRDVDLNEWK